MLFAKLKAGLSKTRSRIASGLAAILTVGRKIDADTLDELEDLLVSSDIGIRTSMALIEDLSARYKDREIKHTEEVIDVLKEDLKGLLRSKGRELVVAASPPTVIMVAGVNGAGKTTSIAKLSKMLKDQGSKVLLSASDTFRAAAVEQLDIWSNRAGVDIVKHESGSDPAAVAFDACDAAVARGSDYVIIDTAGRLHTNRNLMEELAKIQRVIAKKIPGAPHEVLLVLDATTGQNAVSQARLFGQYVNTTGLFLAKLDGTAKGGIVITVVREIEIPVKFIGVGEQMDDIEAFDAGRFVDALFE